MRLALLFLLALAVLGCNYNHVKEEAGTARGGVSIQDLGPLDFATVQAAVIGPKCLSCHSNAGGNQGGSNLESYRAVRAQLGRILFRSLEKRDMPPRAPLNGAQMQALRDWAELGAPKRASGPVQKPDPSLDRGPNDWAKVRDRIFKAKCLDCHSAPEPQAGLDLTSLQETRAKAVVIFDRVIVRQDMPVQPYPSLSPREKRVLLQWFELGMPE